MSDQLTAFQRVAGCWEAAASPAVLVTRLIWPELTELNAALRDSADAFRTSDRARDLRGRAFGLRRILESTPLPASHPVLGARALLDDLAAAERPGFPASLVGPMRRLAAAVRALASSPSPIGQWIEDTASCYGADAGGRPDTVIVVGRLLWAQATAVWLTDAGLDCVDVVLPSELAGRDAYRVALMCGHPTRAFASQWRSPEAAAREFGWLLTAPAAPEIRIALTASEPVFTVGGLWTFDDLPSPTIDISDTGPSRPVLVTDQLDRREISSGWADEPDAGPVARSEDPPEADLRELPDLARISLRSGRTVVFDGRIGPAATAVFCSDEQGDVTTAALRGTVVVTGSLLALPVGASEHEQIVQRANTILTAHGWSPVQVTDLRDDLRDLKALVRRSTRELGRTELTERLVELGTGRSYARTLLANVLAEDYLAPGTEPAFNALMTAVAADRLRCRWTDIQRLRGAHQKAGEHIRADLLTGLRDQRWLTDVEDRGWTTFSTGAATVLLEVVDAVTPGPSRFIPSWLGAPLTSFGARIVRSPVLAGRPL